MKRPYTRVSYNRSDLNDTIQAALCLSAARGKPVFVFATNVGFTIDRQPPPLQRHYAVSPTGVISRREVRHVR